jgi:aerotaxis receptor
VLDWTDWIGERKEEVARKRIVEALDREREFRVEELFFSITDEKGIIRYGNEVFERIAGYTEEELLGAPHNIIRHPDMPRAVFQLLWDTIQAGGTIAAYVKNLAQDGCYYWVLAVVMPCDGGFLSVRLKPSSELLPTVRGLYAEMLALERQKETEPRLRREAIEASTQLLAGRLLDLGFSDYEAFQQHALSTESSSRLAALDVESPAGAGQDGRVGRDGHELVSILDHCTQLDAHLQGQFQLLDEFKAMNLRLSERSESVRTTADDIRVLALNASIASTGMGDRGKTLQVVARTLGESSNRLEETIEKLTLTTRQIIGAVDGLIFNVAATKLQSEIGIQFLREMLQASNGASTGRMADSLRTLLEEIVRRTAHVFQHVADADADFGELEARIQLLMRSNKALRFVQFAGSKEAATAQETESFGVLFAKAQAFIEKNHGDCADMSEAIQAIRTHVDTIHGSQPEIDQQAAAIQRWSSHAATSAGG